MPRDLSSPIKAELGKTNLALPVCCVRITLSPSNILRWSDRTVTFNDGSGSQTYSARLMGLTGMDFSPDQTGPIQITIANPDGAITTLDQDESFNGAAVEVLAYLPGIDTYYLLWGKGWCDEISQISAESATIIAYPTASTPNVQLPKRVVALPCSNTFGNTANWVNIRDFEGSECPYQRTSSIGFFGNLVGALDNSTNPVSFSVLWANTSDTEGAKWNIGEYLGIGAEMMLITAAGAVDGSHHQALTCTRAKKGTAMIVHADNDPVYFKDCSQTQDGCTRRGMYGNNALDTYTPPGGGSAKSNYFGGFPYVVGFQRGNYRTAAGQHSHPLRVVFSGNDGSYGRALPVAYGRCRVADPVLLIAKPEGDFLTTLWAVCEGLLGTNPADDSQSGSGYTRNYAYAATTTPAGYRLENIFVNGESRHDPRPGFGIEVVNGDQGEAQPASAFFPTDPSDFITNNFGYWGTARVAFRINTKDSPSVDVTGQQVGGSMELQYGRVHRVYSDTVTFVRRPTDDGLYPGANPAWVIMDLLASKRAGAGLDYSRLNIQSFIDAAAYCSATVADTYYGTNVKRWTFNGIIDQRKSLQQWLQTLCLSFYCLPPYADGNGKIKIRVLKSESTSGVPLFSSKVASATARNIVWSGPHSSLVKSRLPITQIPNEVRVNFIDKSYNPGFVADLQGSLNNSTDPITFTVKWGADAVAAGVMVRLNNKIIIDSEIFWVTNNPAPPDGSRNQSLTCQRAYNSTTKDNHAIHAIVQFWDTSSYGKIAITIADRDSQTQFGTSLGDQTLRVMTKVVDLPGVTTFDEASRIATLILRAGEFGQGGVSNNLQITFSTFYRDCEDLEIGDIIQAEDDLLDPVDEAYFRVLKITPQPLALTDGGIVMSRQIVAVLHDNTMYDDTALTTPKFERVDAPGASDSQPLPVTGFSIVESGIFDANSKPSTNLVVNYTVPSPLGNFRSVLIFDCTDDGSGNPVGDWHLTGEVLATGQSIIDPVTGTYRHFCAVSRPLSGHTPDVDSIGPDGSYIFPRVRILLDGYADSALPAPTGLVAGGRDKFIVLNWDKYTGNNAQLCKAFNIYRSTSSDPATAVLIARKDGNIFSDDSPTILANPTTTYYYWVKGVSVLENVTINGTTWTEASGLPLSAFSSSANANPGTDASVPNAPAINVVRNSAGLSPGDYTFIFGVQKPGSPTNYDTVFEYEYAVSIDNFSTSLIDQLVQSQLPDVQTLRLNAAGIYYFRARVYNIFGVSAWSTTYILNTDGTAGLSDSDVPVAPLGLAVAVSTAGNPIAGNGYQVQFSYGTPARPSEWGYSVFVHDSNTLPTTHQAETPRTNGTLNPGSNRITVPGSPWTASQWVSPDAYEVVYFGPYRSPSSPSWDLDGMVGHTTITGNGVNYIDFDFAPDRQILNRQANLIFWIVKKGVGDHLWEKCKAYAMDIVDSTDVRNVRRVDVNLQSPTVYAWAVVHSVFGMGKLAGPSSSASYLGLTSGEYKNASVLTATLANLAVTAPKTNIVNLGDITLSLGTVQTGLLQTASSGARVTIDSTNGLEAFDNASNLIAQIPSAAVAGSAYLKFLQARPISAASSAGVILWNGDLSHFAVMRSAFVVDGNSVINGSGAFIGLGGVDLTGLAVGLKVDNGQGLAWDAATSIYTGATKDVRIYCNGDRFKIDDDATASETPMLLNVAGGGLVRVSVGANDSGGTGYRLLRVPN